MERRPEGSEHVALSLAYDFVPSMLAVHPDCAFLFSGTQEKSEVFVESLRSLPEPFGPMVRGIRCSLLFEPSSLLHRLLFHIQ